VVYAQAVQRFGRAGSFAYRGTVHGGGPSRLRPGLRLPADVTVEGAVRLPQSITREVAIDESGHAVETVTSGSRVWGRQARGADDLEDAPWEVVEPPGTGFLEPRPTRLGMALVSDIVRRAGPGRDVVPDGEGRRRLSAPLRGDAGRKPRYGDALAGGTVTITLDDAGDIARIVVASAEPDPQLVLDLDIDRLGEPDVITAADVGEPARQAVAGELAGLGIAPVELGRLPTGWALTDASVWSGAPYRPNCTWLGLEYRDLLAVSGGELSLTVTDRDRCPGDTRGPRGEPLRARSFTGTIEEDDPGTQTNGWLSDGVTDVGFSTDLPATEVTRLLESLQPFDVNNAKTD
jgi:hypothetical protein